MIMDVKGDFGKMSDKIKKFIEIHIPVTTCNLKCHYCYIAQQRKFSDKWDGLSRSIDDIKKAFSRKRLGGVCMLNLCGGGGNINS